MKNKINQQAPKDLEREKHLAAQHAVQYIKDGQIIGLGSGSTAKYAIKAIGELVKNGLNIQGVPTSAKTKQLAESLQIPLLPADQVKQINITIDGADEFTEDLILIKGGGGALLYEKIIASLTDQLIIITDSSKLVHQLGRFKLPVEVIPVASNYVKQQLEKLGGKVSQRITDNNPFVTDEGNYILDTDFNPILNPVYLSNQMSRITGVVEHGLFIGLASMVIMGMNEETKIFEL